MAEEAKIEETQEAPKPRPKPYYVQSMVRRQGTRLHRAKSATRHRFKLFIGGRRLLRNQKMPLSAEKVEELKDQLMEMVLAGQIALFTPDGMRITSLPDGRLVYTKPNGATKIGDAPPQPEPKNEPVPEGEGEMVGDQPADPPEEPEDEGGGGEEEAASPDDLTALPGIGGGRAKKLADAGITSFAGLVELGPEGLSELLGLSADAAEELHAAAEEMKG